MEKHFHISVKHGVAAVTATPSKELTDAINEMADIAYAIVPPKIVEMMEEENAIPVKCEYTPGPWLFHQNGDGSYSIFKKLDDGRYQWITSFFENGEFIRDKQLANIKLIVAAPELLDALILIRDVLKDWDACTGNGKYKNLIYHADVFIKKATE